MCHRSSTRNKEYFSQAHLPLFSPLLTYQPCRLILTYLIPTHLLTTRRLPTSTILRPYPRLHALFYPLIIAIRAGNLSAFDATLNAGEDEFVKRRIYLTLERGRDVALRNLLRKVYVVGGKESRVPLGMFTAAVRVGGNEEGVEGVEGDEVECLLANIIYKVRLFVLISSNRSVPLLSRYLFHRLPNGHKCSIITSPPRIPSPRSPKLTRTRHRT
jgi:hypothetical protein